jgi:23S rRNA pseudouridine2457 synthase
VDYRYVALNKPYGAVTQFSDRQGLGHQTLSDCINLPGIYPVGRLDKDSEGLVLLTDDGATQHRLSHPRFEHEKTYWVQVEGVPSSEALAALERGVAIQDYVTMPAAARLLEPAPAVAARVPPIRYRARIPDCWLELKLIEGKNRQVRRMTAAVGHPTLRLIRVAIGPIELGDLAPGQWRHLSTSEQRALLR